MRSEVMELGKLGPLPSHKSVLANPDGEALVKKYQDLIGSIKPPVTDAEARVLVGIFGVDECFELEWPLIRLIETAPNWPLFDCLVDSGNEWIALLRQRVETAKRPELRRDDWRNIPVALIFLDNEEFECKGPDCNIRDLGCTILAKPLR